MLRSALALLLVGLVCPIGLCADKTVKKPIGTWKKDAGGRTLVFTVKADTMTITLSEGDKKVEATAAYGVTDEGLLFGVITKVERKGLEGGPEKGQLFSFQFEAKKTELTISDLNGTQVNDEARKHVEGVYSAERK